MTREQLAEAQRRARERFEGGTGTDTGSGTGGVYRPGAGIVNPRLLREVRPQYTAEALRAEISGTVYLETVVLPDGTVGNVRITRSLDPVYGLDEEVIKAARQWLFETGTRFGVPVSILVNLARGHDRGPHRLRDPGADRDRPPAAAAGATADDDPGPPARGASPPAGTDAQSSRRGRVGEPTTPRQKDLRTAAPPAARRGRIP